MLAVAGGAAAAGGGRLLVAVAAQVRVDASRRREVVVRVLKLSVAKAGARHVLRCIDEAGIAPLGSTARILSCTALQSVSCALGI